MPLQVTFHAPPLSTLRTDYVHEQQERYRAQLAHSIAEAMRDAAGADRVKLTKQQTNHRGILMMEEKAASASMVFVGNINQGVDVLLKTSHLFDPFPEAMAYDTAFLDRMHCYIPGWVIPKLRPEHFTDDYGFIKDFLAEFMRGMCKEPFGDVLDRFFCLGFNLNQRDVIAVRKTVSCYIKLLYLDGIFANCP